MESVEVAVLNFLTSELTSHGAILFAVLAATYSYLRIIENHSSKNNEVSKLFNLVSWIGLAILFGLSIYVLTKLLSYAMLVNVLTQTNIQNNHSIDELISTISEEVRLFYSRPRGLPMDFVNWLFLQLYNFDIILRSTISLLLGSFFSSVNLMVFSNHFNQAVSNLFKKKSNIPTISEESTVSVRYELTNEEKQFTERVKPLIKEFLEKSKEIGSYVLSINDNIYHGVPLEHIRCVHGEENAIGTMITEEGKEAKLKIILVVGSPDEIIMPCGICREAIKHYGVKNVTVLCSNSSLSKIEKFTIQELYPRPYESEI